MTDKKDKLLEAYRELRNWLDSECPAVAPPLEPYDTSDLSHNFCELLRIRLDEIASIESELTPEPIDDKMMIGWDVLNPPDKDPLKKLLEFKPQMTAEEFLFNKYPLVSKDWFKDNDLTQEMIKMMNEYAEYASQFQKPEIKMPSEEEISQKLKIWFLNKSHVQRLPAYSTKWINQLKWLIRGAQWACNEIIKRNR